MLRLGDQLVDPVLGRGQRGVVDRLIRARPARVGEPAALFQGIGHHDLPVGSIDGFMVDDVGLDPYPLCREANKPRIAPWRDPNQFFAQSRAGTPFVSDEYFHGCNRANEV